MKLGKTMKTTLATGALLAACVLPMGGVQAMAGEQPAAAPATVQQVESTPKQSNKRLLQWGVGLYALGEFGGLLGMGISHIRKEKRKQLKEEQHAAALAARYAPYGTKAAAPLPVREMA